MAEWRGFLFEFIEEWSQFFEPCNWYTFHPFMFEVEDDRHLGGVECTFIILGIGFRARWNHTETDDIKEIIRRKNEIDEGLTTSRDEGGGNG